MAQQQWVLDTAHSQAQFKVRHMMISTVTGELSAFDVQVTTEGTDFTTAKARFNASVDAIETKNKQREAHLKTSDFFDADNHPDILFESTGIPAGGKADYEMEGKLTIRGVTKPVVLQVEQGGQLEDSEGKIHAGFEISGTINRRDFGLQFNAVTESGGMVVSDEVRLLVSIELVQG